MDPKYIHLIIVVILAALMLSFGNELLNTKLYKYTEALTPIAATAASAQAATAPITTQAPTFIDPKDCPKCMDPAKLRINLKCSTTLGSSIWFFGFSFILTWIFTKDVIGSLLSSIVSTMLLYALSSNELYNFAGSLLAPNTVHCGMDKNSNWGIRVTTVVIFLVIRLGLPFPKYTGTLRERAAMIQEKYKITSPIAPR